MFERIYDYHNLYDAYIKARKQKRYRGEVLQFSYALEENLITLQKELIWKTYKVGAYRPFVIYEPKKRQIVALPFRDRVVQHALNAVIEPMFERRMIHDSYACRVGKGTHQATRRVAYFLGKPGNYYGYRIWSRNKLIKKQSLDRMRKKARAWRHGKISDGRFLASLGSWMGHSADTASHPGQPASSISQIYEQGGRP